MEVGYESLRVISDAPKRIKPPKRENFLLVIGYRLLGYGQTARVGDRLEITR
jgi:hypothetical protein